MKSSKKKPSSGLVHEVLGQVKHAKPGLRTWFERLPPEAQDELEAVRVAFDHKQHQKRAYAEAVIAAARARGWAVAGRQGVIAWLERKR